MASWSAALRRHRELAVEEAEATKAYVVGTGTQEELHAVRERLRVVEWWLEQKLKW